ncbi:MAG: acyltransferase [Ruminococcus sp.]|nr:acyltransferase [Ruminococcus sp.]
MARRMLDQKRNYGIDALRILSMLMIIFYHILHHPNLLPTRVRFTPGYDVVLFTQLALMCAVNCYVLISGYVGVASPHKYSRVVELWLTVLCYSAGITLMYYLFRPGSVTFTVLWRSFLPLLSREYWFFSSYFVLFLLMPLLNNAVNTLSRRRLEVILVSLMLFIGVFGSIYNSFTNTDSFGVNRGFSAWWMMVLYLVGAYIRKYDIFAHTKRYRFLLVFFITAAFSTALKLLMQYHVIQTRHNVNYFNALFINYTSLNLWICAISLLLFFRGLHFKPVVNRIIAFLTPMTFSVYLIHDHPIIRARITKSSLLFLGKMPTPTMLLCAAGIAVGVYLVCSAVDLIRWYLFRLLKLRQRLDTLETRVKKRLTKEKT